MTHHTKENQALILARRIAAATIFEPGNPGTDQSMPKRLIPGSYTPPEVFKTLNRIAELNNMGRRRLSELSLDVAGSAPISLLEILQSAKDEFLFEPGPLID